MDDALAGEAAKALSARRWGSQRAVRLAHELAQRADELPEAERAQLLKALRRKTPTTSKEPPRVW